MGTHPDTRMLIDEMRRSDSIRSREFLSRFVLMATGCAVGLVWLGLDLIVYWFAAYYAAVLIEKFLLVQYPAARSRLFMALLVSISAVIGTIYVALPVYLWYRPDRVLHFAALVLLVAGCLNVYQLRARVWPIALAYYVPIGVGFVVMAAGFWTQPLGGAEFWAAFAVAILISCYFALTLFEAQKSNWRILSTRAHLINSQKIAALETVAAGIAHDFRGLLGIIQGNLELLREHPRASDRSACIEDALAAARSASDLCDRLGHCSRRMATGPALVDPITVVEDVRLMARHILPATIRLQTQIPSAMDPIRVDESALQAVLLNLVAHARDMIEGAGTIFFETYSTGAMGSPDDVDRKRVVFEIGNTGPCAVSDMREATDPSGPIDGRHRNALALATARAFTELCGGDFSIEPNLGKGTRVLLQLPC